MTCSTPAAMTFTSNNSVEHTIKVIGIGAYGKQAIEHLTAQGIYGIECIALHSDAQKLHRAATESAEVKSLLDEVDMIFIVAEAESDAMLSAAKLAKIAHEQGILTFTILRNGSGTVQHDVLMGALLTMPHQTKVQDFNTQVEQTVRAIVDVIITPGLVNVDLSDVGILIGNNTRAMTCSGMASGADRAWMAATQAMGNFSNCDTSISNASSLLINITSNNKLKLGELEQAMKAAHCAAEEAMIIVGSVFDEAMGDALRITVVAMGI